MSEHTRSTRPDESGSGDPEAALRDARERFIAAFPKRADSIGLLLNMVITVGPTGPVVPLLEIVHRTAGLAGTLGFPTVSTSAHELERLLAHADREPIDGSRANAVFDALRDGFSEDLMNPPPWVLASAAPAPPRRIMVVEDDEDQREVVSIHLRAAGHAVIPVADGNSVLERARTDRPDLILLDANLPGIDGYSLCRALKTDPDLASIPVVFTTVRAKTDDKAVGLLLGADEYLTKPLDFSELLIRVSVLLDRRDRRPAAAAGAQVAGEDPSDLDYESFVIVAREQLAASPGILGIMRVPETRLMETFGAVRADLRRRDLVACLDSRHLVLLMIDMPPARARDRLKEIVTDLKAVPPQRFAVGLAHSPAPGEKAFEVLLGEADEAVSCALHRGLVVAVAGEAPPAPDAVPPAAGTILIADDDPEVARLLDRPLRAAGYETVAAADGEQALAFIDAHKPDAVVLDLMMPGLSGFDVLARLRQRAPGPRVVVLSLRGQEQDIARAFALGADDYVTKPFNPQDLLARVARLLR